MNDNEINDAVSTRKATVFITQIPVRRDKETGASIPVFNIAPAAEYGEIKVMMPSGANFFATGDLVRQAKNALRDYNPENGDSIVAMGDPSVIAVCIAVIAKKHDKFYVLKWDRVLNRYIRIEVNI